MIIVRFSAAVQALQGRPRLTKSQKVHPLHLKELKTWLYDYGNVIIRGSCHVFFSLSLLVCNITVRLVQLGLGFPFKGPAYMLAGHKRVTLQMTGGN